LGMGLQRNVFVGIVKQSPISWVFCISMYFDFDEQSVIRSCSRCGTVSGIAAQKSHSISTYRYTLKPTSPPLHLAVLPPGIRIVSGLKEGLCTQVVPGINSEWNGHLLWDQLGRSGILSSWLMFFFVCRLSVDSAFAVKLAGFLII
jgi:hypothetical protein